MSERCAPYVELLRGYLDGELTAEETHEVEQHLAGCADCGRGSRRCGHSIERSSHELPSERDSGPRDRRLGGHSRGFVRSLRPPGDRSGGPGSTGASRSAGRPALRPPRARSCS